MRYPLRNQLMLPMVAVAAASLAAVAVVNANLATRQTRARIEHQLRGVLRVLASSSFPLTDPVLRQMKGLSSAEFISVDSSGRRTASSIVVPLDALPAHGTVAEWDRVVLGPEITLGGKRYYHTSLEQKSRSPRGDPGILHVLFPRTEYSAVWRTAFVPPLLIGLVAVTAVAFVAHWFARRIGSVSASLGNHVQRLARGDYQKMELPPRDDELRDLALAVNQTADRLKEYEQQVRRTEQMRTTALLGAGLAHEMRNAATGCRMAVDLHAEGCPVGAEDESLQVARQQLQLMESRLQRFLQIGRPATPTARAPVDLGKLVDELVPLVRPAAQHAGVQLQWSPPEAACMVQGDTGELEQAIMNLLLNAIEAARGSAIAPDQPARVIVQLQRAAEARIGLTVADSGSGPPDNLAPALYEPFVSSKPEGIGLGLTVVQQVVHAHGGALDWFRRDGLTWFCVQLPSALGGVQHG